MSRMAMNSTRLFRAAVGVLMLTAVLPAAAQKTTSRSLPNEPGKWKPWTFINLSSSDLKLLGFTLPEARAFETRLKQIAEIFRASPIWNPPMGVDPALTGMALGPEAYSSPYAKKLTYRRSTRWRPRARRRSNTNGGTGSAMKPRRSPA
jgi:hypothetical protein